MTRSTLRIGMVKLCLLFAWPTCALAADPAFAFHWNGVTGSGLITLLINTSNGTYVKTLPYGTFSSAASLAGAFGGRLSSDTSAPVWAKGNPDGTISMKLRVAGVNVTSLQATIKPDGGGSAPTGTSIDTNVGGVASGGGSGPQISGLSISHAKLGQSVLLSGVNFGTSTTNSPQTTVTLDGSPVKFSLQNTTSISVTIRNGDESGNFAVSVGSASSNGVYFTVDAPDLCVVYPTFPTN